MARISISPCDKTARMLLGEADKRQGFQSVLVTKQRRCCWVMQSNGKDFDLSLSQIGEDVVG